MTFQVPICIWSHIEINENVPSGGFEPTTFGIDAFTALREPLFIISIIHNTLFNKFVMSQEYTKLDGDVETLVEKSQL